MLVKEIRHYSGLLYQVEVGWSQDEKKLYVFRAIQ
jgi:hypothetical protein